MATRKIIWNTKALADRIDILEYWLERTGNNRYPNKLDDSLLRAIHQIALQPESGLSIPGREEDISTKVRTRYIINTQQIPLELYKCGTEEETRSSVE